MFALNHKQEEFSIGLAEGHHHPLKCGELRQGPVLETTKRCPTACFLSRPIQIVSHANAAPKMELRCSGERAQHGLLQVGAGLDFSSYSFKFPLTYPHYLYKLNQLILTYINSVDQDPLCLTNKGQNSQRKKIPLRPVPADLRVQVFSCLVYH